MSKEMWKQARETAEEYQHEREREAYLSGFNHGLGFAENNVPSIGEELWIDGEGKVTVDRDNIRDVHQSLCYEAERNSREYSPFEFTAHELNSLDEADGEGASEAAWGAFDQGIADAIAYELSTYTDEDYGIGEEEDEEDC